MNTSALPTWCRFWPGLHPVTRRVQHGYADNQGVRIRKNDPYLLASGQQRNVAWTASAPQTVLLDAGHLWAARPLTINPENLIMKLIGLIQPRRIP